MSRARFPKSVFSVLKSSTMRQRGKGSTNVCRCEIVTVLNLLQSPDVSGLNSRRNQWSPKTRHFIYSW